MLQHRKRVKHYHEPGDVHELTFSCVHRQKLLTNNAWRICLARSIDQACEEHSCTLAAFVFMPEHVHLLVFGIQSAEQISTLLIRIKNPTSAQVKADLDAANSPLLKKLTIRDRPGKYVFRYWQEGPGYDRNLQTTAAVQAALNYLHENPIRRKLCQKTRDWRWSSARFYESDGREIDSDLPRITPPPPDFLSSC